ncbi:hypothetical protein LWI29_036522 [Acer saccharum]|uniref:Uncharacterized protein n=1 Tax=Acer saccharum TaxID=4024 RepID=A0AA39SN89_ACESA|nr:hypothetical protein LWI29_036522 [Acer saccharum]
MGREIILSEVDHEVDEAKAVFQNLYVHFKLSSNIHWKFPGSEWHEDLMGCRYVNDENYNGGVKILDTVPVFCAMESNYRSWVYGFAHMAIRADMPEAMQEFRGLYSI